MSVEGLSIGAASAIIGQRHMELPDIREEKEEETISVLKFWEV
jgi:hypothetical protein